jgi:hypothetical protein
VQRRVPSDRRQGQAHLFDDLRFESASFAHIIVPTFSRASDDAIAVSPPGGVPAASQTALRTGAGDHRNGTLTQPNRSAILRDIIRAASAALTLE